MLLIVLCLALTISWEVAGSSVAMTEESRVALAILRLAKAAISSNDDNRPPVEQIPQDQNGCKKDGGIRDMNEKCECTEALAALREENKEMRDTLDNLVIIVDRILGHLDLQETDKQNIETTTAITDLLSSPGPPETTSSHAKAIACDTTVRGSQKIFAYNTTIVSCPQNCQFSTGSIWGTGVYTDDSRVCKAAVHDGKISASKGGEICVRKLPGRSVYYSASKNGISTRSYGSWDASFTFCYNNEYATTREPERLSTEQSQEITSSPSKDITCDTTVRGYQKIFAEYETIVMCPPNCHLSTGSIWGTGVYTDDSRVCKAAVHDGKISASRGGIICVRKLPGRRVYYSNSKNGISTRSYGSWDASFTFCYDDQYATTGAPQIQNTKQSQETQAKAITCDTAVRGSQIFANSETIVRCPPNCHLSAGNIWGTGTYTDDSRVCKAAVHDGKISASRGGIICVRKTPGQRAYTSSLKNGISTRSYGSWDASFSFCYDNQYVTTEAAEILRTEQSQERETTSSYEIHIACNTTVRGSQKIFADNETIVSCPPNCQLSTGKIWGTRVYTDDSRVCKAAVHDGKLLASRGGFICVRKLPGRGDYASSSQNGISSSSYGSWDASFSFCIGNQNLVTAAPELLSPESSEVDAQAIEISCDSTVRGSSGIFTDDITIVKCPANCHVSSGSVWGTGVYTDDSRICKSAIHDGKVSSVEGGIAYVKKLPGQSGYTSTTANGITTLSYGSWDASFRFCQSIAC